MARVVIVGATSGIGRALASEFARRSAHELILAARDLGEATLVASDISIRFAARCRPALFDICDYAQHENVLLNWTNGGPIEGLVLTVGLLSDQGEAETALGVARQMIEVNFTACAMFLLVAARFFSRQGRGFICVIGSVAGDRGRRSNYIYGASKGALAILTEGLRARLSPSGVRVTLVKPGFVDTRMTFGSVRQGSLLLVPPETAARQIYNAIVRGKTEAYVPPYWKYIMMAIRWMPRAVFQRLSL